MMTIWNHLQGVDFQQRFYDAAGVRTRVIESGSSEKVLIFLHGTGGHAEAYVKNIASHSEHFRVMAIDMVGHGYTDAPDISYDMQCYVDFLLDFLNAIGVEKAYISGESLGATVAAWFALAHQIVLKIVMNTGMLLPPDEKGAIGLRELLERSRKSGGSPSRETVRQRMRWLMLNERT